MTPEDDVADPRIFVFGSNQAGRHGAGAARFARLHRGAIYGCGEGLQGRSYGIPTKDARLHTLDLDQIGPAIERFLAFARAHPELRFEVTPVGCGLAGYSPSQIAPFFAGAPGNCDLPAVFRTVLAALTPSTSSTEGSPEE